MDITWLPLELTDVSTQSAVYGFRQGEHWLYIGKAMNLAKRLNRQHIPLQIALGLPVVTLLYALSDSRHKLERHLIKTLKPDWNGGTSWTGDRYPCCNRMESWRLSTEHWNATIASPYWSDQPSCIDWGQIKKSSRHRKRTLKTLSVQK